MPAAILIFDLCSPHGSQKPLISALAVIFDHWLFKGMPESTAKRPPLLASISVNGAAFTAPWICLPADS
ncbi:MAG: hypothetical protein ACLTEF_12210 [[Clostridium] leptum]